MAGIPVSVVPAALAAAAKARGTVLDRMDACSPAPGGQIRSGAPHIRRMAIPADQIGLVIGSGGRTIKQLTADSGCSSMQARCSCGSRTTGLP